MPYHVEEFNALNSAFSETASNFLDNGTIDDLQQVLDNYNALICYSELGWDRKHKPTKHHIITAIEACTDQT